jgi:predicted metal-binding membrane protein
MARQGPLEWVLARERLLVLAALIVAVVLAWAYLGMMAGGMHGAMGAMPWTASHAAIMLSMWTVMMVGMMLPAATPMILFFVTFVRRSREQGHQVAPVSAFVAGYVAVWSAFALVATGLQWTLNRAALLSPHMATISPVLGGTILISAGIYQ